MIFIIGLILLGVLLLVLEILMLPGLIAGIAGVVLIMFAISWMYAEYGSTAGNIAFISSFLISVLAVYASLKSKAWNRFGLKSTIDSKVNDITHTQVQPGDQGVCVSALRPSGTIEVNGHRMEASTTGTILQAGSIVEITEVLAGKVLVKPL